MFFRNLGLHASSSVWLVLSSILLSHMAAPSSWLGITSISSRTGCSSWFTISCFGAEMSPHAILGIRPFIWASLLWLGWLSHPICHRVMSAGPRGVLGQQARLAWGRKKLQVTYLSMAPSSTRASCHMAQHPSTTPGHITQLASEHKVTLTSCPSEWGISL